METLTKQEQAAAVSPSDTDREELRSALNRMMEASAAWKRERAQLAAACDQLRRQLHDSKETTASLERERDQIAATRDQLQHHLKDKEHSATGWESERAGLAAETDDLRRQIDDTEEAAALALDRQITTAVDRVRPNSLGKTKSFAATLTVSPLKRRNCPKSAIGSSQNSKKRADTGR